MKRYLFFPDADLSLSRTADDEVSVDGDDDDGEGGHEDCNAGQGLHQPVMRSSLVFKHAKK